MPRNATTSPSIHRRASQWTSHLRQFSRTSLDKDKSSLDVPREDTRSPDTMSINSASTVRDASHPSPRRVMDRICTVTINESVIRDEVLLNLDLIGGAVKPGMLMSITALESDQQDRTTGSYYGSLRASSYRRGPATTEGPSKPRRRGCARHYIFVVKDMAKELKARHPTTEIYVAKHIADAFNLRNRSQVVLAPVDHGAPAVQASHVELTFKDMYLSRSDMWRLAVDELSDRTVYKGQVIYFLGTIKATVSTVFVDGRKVHSAFFGHDTRPIFRSECARYVLFIQMAREMWDFDSDGSGEILFYKVVNGFLPALFKKWAMMQVRHLVSIVLFARMEYDTGLSTELANASLHDDYYTGYQSCGSKRPYKDFYRVVVSEMSSGEWTTILHQLKKEFNTFRRDISLHHQYAMNCPMENSEDPSIKSTAVSRIKAESSLAMYGNFLEAINMASSQYANDYIDRDLLRTGISIVVISPGSGVFEVEYETLRRSTESLIRNGIGIDLICIPNLPLHSVPLFRYRNPHFLTPNQRPQARSLRSRDGTPKQPTPLVGSYNSMTEPLTPAKASDTSLRTDSLISTSNTDEWTFALPQWLHVSYWTGNSADALAFHGATLNALVADPKSHEDEFTARCRLYELQMRSVLETNEIEAPPLYADSAYPKSAITSVKEQKSTNQSSLTVTPRSRRMPDSLFEYIYGFQKFAPDKLAKGRDASLWKNLQAFDESRSQLPPQRPQTAAKSHANLEEKARKKLVEDIQSLSTSVPDKRGQGPTVSLSSSVASTSTHKEIESLDAGIGSRRDSTASRPHFYLPPVKTPKLIRQISLGQRGFGIAAPAVATAELKTENVNALQASNQPSTPMMTPVKSSLRPPTPRGATGLGTLHPFEQVKSDLSEQMNDLTRGTPSRPMPIKSFSSNTGPLSTLRSASIIPTPLARSARPDDRDIKYSNALRAEDEQKLYNSKLLAGATPELPSTLSPTAAMSPWLVVLNPSNPDVSKIDDSLLFSRWQHVFPRPSDMKVMKWKSLSCPAAVPLTTEYFPSKSQFDTEYQRQPYNVAQNIDDETTEAPKSREEFLRELVSARFSHGFQVVIGPSVARAFGQKTVRITELFDRNNRVEDGTSIFMSVGNTIHQLSCMSGTEVEVNIYLRKPSATLPQAEQISPLYKPAIRTLHDKNYETLHIDIVTPKPERNWNYIDSYLAGHTDEVTDALRVWKARFVLIPMCPRGCWGPKTVNGDDEEETRLEGIKKLAQLWQRHRIMSASERHFQSSSSDRDPYPLDIVYRTEDPSVVVAAELEALPLFEGFETISRKRQLVTNKERFSKSNFNLAILAEAIQQPPEAGGVKMKTRRWHLRLHYNCFIGSEMTTWLLDNFDDIESREEAVELGNSLMVQDDGKSKDRDRDVDKEASKDSKKDRDRGIFVHVERRHPFRDGQYFYQMASEFAKPAAQGWFNTRKPQASVPATPLSDIAPKDSPRLAPSIQRPTSIYDDNSPVSGSTTPTMGTTSGKRPQVVLSKVMKYDVDHRKRSYRPERISLHYDRLHNPDNCFHIRIDWVNVTAKLIEDAIKSWASIAMQHGLRLVEVPIAEACTITDVNPFRRPYRVKLALPPPTQRPFTYYESNSFAPQTQPCKHYYQKALLRKFDYVLDVEAASNFPSNVDVSYSWGHPNFKYSQYIHRSGLILAEITEDGDFLLLANRLYSNRAAASQPVPGRATADPPIAAASDRVSSRLLSASVSGIAGSQHGMPEPTPMASPMFRPALFSPKGPASRGFPAAAPPQPGSDPVVTSAGSATNFISNYMSPSLGPQPSQSQSQTQTQIPQPPPLAGPGGPGFTDGEQGLLKDLLEAFCSDTKQLADFYRETLERGPGTPATGSMPATVVQAPATTMQDGTGNSTSVPVPDSGIPTLGLPPGILSPGAAAVGVGGGSGSGSGGESSPSPNPNPGPRAPTPSGLQKSGFFRRGSVQHL